MIDCCFQSGATITVIRVSGKEVTFNQNMRGVPMFTTIEGLRLNPSTIVEEFPDLKGKPIEEIRGEAIRRFKEHIKSLPNEESIRDYIKEDLGKHGYRMLFYQKRGFRPVKV
jgi:hypothetical protein